MKRNLSKLTGYLVLALCIICLSACGNNSVEQQNKESKQTPSNINKTQEETDSSENAKENAPSEQNNNQKNDIIKSITCGVDETGIYATVITLSDKAADKGTVEMVYYGVKDSPQENAVVNTFRIEYYKEDAGTFEINTFYDGEVYQNYHHQAKVKITNTFSATTRAGNITVYYTPDGGEKTEIYKAAAESFIKN